MTAKLMASAMSRKSCPEMSSTNTIGKKTATVVRVEATTAPQTSLVPLIAAVKESSPVLKRWWMFSRTTTALSTSIPTANAIPARLITLSDRPAIPKAKNVPTTLVGIANPTTNAPLPNHSPNTTIKPSVRRKNHGEMEIAAIADAMITGIARKARTPRCKKRSSTIIVNAVARKILSVTSDIADVMYSVSS